MNQLENYLAYVFFKTDSFTNATHNLVNHEVGHVFGLDDGGPGAPRPAWPDGDPCLDSIMHSYGCSNNQGREWPTDYDLNSVQYTVVPGGGGGGGGTKG
jgi:hypothetical protein